MVIKKRHSHIILNTSQNNFQVATTSKTSGVIENMPDSPLVAGFGIRIFKFQIVFLYCFEISTKTIINSQKRQNEESLK